MNIKEAAIAIKQGDNSLLEGAGILLHANKKGYICPHCGSGSGDKGTGMQTFTNAKGYNGLKCFNCGNFFNNLELIALAYGLNIDNGGKDYYEAVQIGCEIFGLELDDKEHPVDIQRRPKPNIKPIVKVYTPAEIVDDSVKESVENYIHKHATDEVNSLFKFSVPHQHFIFDNTAHLTCRGKTWECLSDCEKLDLVKGSKYPTRFILAKYLNLPAGGDAADEFNLYKKICELFNIPFKTKADVKAERAAEIMKMVHEDIDTAVTKIADAPPECLRGLTVDILQKFKFGWLEKWIHPTVRIDDKYAAPTRRLLATTPNHYEAMLPTPDRVNVDSAYWKMHTSPREPFFLDILPFTDINLIFEGAVDAASVYYATDGKFACYATGGTSQGNIFIDALQRLDVKGKFVIFYDSDKAGRENAPVFEKAMRSAGYDCECRFLFDDTVKTDANDILINEGKDALAELIEKRLADSDPSDNKVEEQSADDAPTEVKNAKVGKFVLPVDIQIPKGYLMNRYGIYKETQKGNVLITCTPVLISKTFDDDNNENGAVELLVYDRCFDRWHKHRLLKEILASTTGIVKLAAFGVSITQADAKFLSKYLMSMMYSGNNPKLIPRCRMYKMPGWTDSSCRKYIFPISRDDSYMVGTGAFDYYRAFNPKGNVKDWIEIFIEMVSKSYVARVVCGAALSAPLIRICGTRNLQLHLCGKSGSGKTALVKLAMSVAGNPDKLMRSFNSTMLASEKFSVYFNDCPHAFNELQAKKKITREEEGDTFIYTFEEGQTRAKLNRNSDLREGAGEFRGVRITTGEQSITQMSSGEGAKARIVELPESNIFSNDDAIRLHQFFDDDNFGHFWRQWIDFITETHANDNTYFKKVMDFYSKKIRQRHADAVHNHVTTVAMAYTGLGEFVEHILKDTAALQLFGREFFNDCTKIFADAPTKTGAENSVRAIDCLYEFVNTSHSGRFFTQFKTENEEFWSDVHSSVVAAGYIFADGRVAFAPRQLKNILEVDYKFPSAEAIIRAFAEKGWLIVGNIPGRKYQTRVVCGKDHRQKPLLVFKPGILSE